MKFYAYVHLLALTASAAVLSQAPNQVPSVGAGTSDKPVKVQDVKPRIRTTAKRQFIRYGPLKLSESRDTGKAPTPTPAHGGHESSTAKSSKGAVAMDPNGTPFQLTLTEGFCTDCTVLAAKLDLVFENDTRADIVNGVYLHHMIALLVGNSTGKGKSSWVDICPKTTALPSAAGQGATLGGLSADAVAANSFVGGAVDEFTDYFTSPDGKIDSGYFVPARNAMILSGEAINYLQTPQEVFIRLDIEWLPGKQGVDAVKTPLNVEGCDYTHSAFKNAVADKGKLTSEAFVVSRDVTVVCQRGHMHDGGDAVTAFVNGKKICTSTATYGSAGAQTVVDGKKWTTISKMSECIEPLELKKGDNITIEATYDNIAHPLRLSHGEAQGNMAFMTFTVVPKST